ncbi:LOW QUALITY PROTEIN: F-box only protein 16 [Cottoperca gobio]|uniref:LOW QUALITY PROTEIN: F-box only protein 16 n=1 Tax=Cottoperca gobio TaxID=56716 RepID=A0A6J2SAK9_COTGO|nr:LOW QUALITY PROTEIN: F-box only protein 16 [Cottoperca gobio]
MPIAPRSSANCAKMRTTLSSWTPLNHALSNSKVFEERRSLLGKWFDRWSDSQRKAVLQDFVLSCSVEQLVFLSLSVSRRLPLQAADFTCLLPRALCLYLFSSLDPRSLSRCAQVSWHWKSIVEVDQLWRPKCARLGWSINFSPTPLEQGIWKRHYIQTVQELRLTSLQTASSQQQFVVPPVSAIRHEDLSEVAFISEERPASSSQPLRSISRTGFRKEKQPAAPPPWRDADRRPEDTLRFNYLDNLDPTEQGRVNFRASTCRSNSSKPGDGSRKTLSEAHYKLRKAKSLMFLSSNCRPQHPPPLPPPPHHETRPSWASRSHDHPVTKETAKSLLRLAQWNAGIRPGPVRSAVPRLSVEALRASQRSHRSAPSKQSLLLHTSGLNVMKPHSKTRIQDKL